MAQTQKLIGTVLPAAISKDVEKKSYVEASVHPEAEKFVNYLTQTLHAGTKELTSSKPWIRAVVGKFPFGHPMVGKANGRIEIDIAGPLRAEEVMVDGKAVKKYKPMFSLHLPFMSAKILKSFSPWKGFDNAHYTLDFYKRLRLACDVIIGLLEDDMAEDVADPSDREDASPVDGQGE